MTKPNDNWPLVTHSRRIVERWTMQMNQQYWEQANAEADDLRAKYCPVCPHPVHSGRCRVMVEVYAGETSCGCPENDS